MKMENGVGVSAEAHYSASGRNVRQSAKVVREQTESPSLNACESWKRTTTAIIIYLQQTLAHTPQLCHSSLIRDMGLFFPGFWVWVWVGNVHKLAAGQTQVEASMGEESELIALTWKDSLKSGLTFQIPYISTTRKMWKL